MNFGPQMSWKQGLRTYATKGEEAIKKEFLQLHNRDVFEPVHWSKLTLEQRRNALKSLCFLKEKRDETIKGRTCADRRKQRTKVKKRGGGFPYGGS